MKSIILIAFVFLGLQNSFGQDTLLFLDIRTYNYSKALSIRDIQADKIQLSSYGDFILYENLVSNGRYLYQGQEFDIDLGIHLFPQRVYQSLQKSFFQPDPASQHFSPYTFLSGDPINYIDKSGNVKKPIVLYAYNHEEVDRTGTVLKDIKAFGGDAYYVPLADVISKRFEGDFSDFNGRIYIDAHMVDDEIGSVTIERGSKYFDFQSHPRYRGKIQNVDDVKNPFRIRRSGEELGRDIRAFADANKLDVKSIVSGGCQGEKATEGISKGFTYKSSGATPLKKLDTWGVDRNYELLPVGDNVLAEYDFKGIGEARLFAVPAGAEAYPMPTEATALDQKPEFKTLEYREEASIFNKEAPFANGAEYRDMIQHGRISGGIEPLYKHFPVEY